MRDISKENIIKEYVDQDKIDELIKKKENEHLEYARKINDKKQKKAEEEYLKHPDLLIFYKPGAKNGMVYMIETFDTNMTCARCGEMGAYVLKEDANTEAYCKNEMCNMLREQDTQVEGIVELPFGHLLEKGKSLDDLVIMKDFS